MNSKKNKVLSALLASSILATSTSVVSFVDIAAAAETVQVGTVADLQAAVQKGGTIELTADLTVDSSIEDYDNLTANTGTTGVFVVPTGVTATIDFAGHKITNNANVTLFRNEGTLTLTDSQNTNKLGYHNSEKDETNILDTTGAYTLHNFGTATIEKVQIIKTNSWACVINGNNDLYTAPGGFTGATLYIKDGCYISKEDTDGNAVNQGSTVKNDCLGENKVYIEGGIITGGNSSLYSYSYVKMTGGEVRGFVWINIETVEGEDESLSDQNPQKKSVIDLEGGYLGDTAHKVIIGPTTTTEGNPNSSILQSAAEKYECTLNVNGGTVTAGEIELGYDDPEGAQLKYAKCTLNATSGTIESTTLTLNTLRWNTEDTKYCTATVGSNVTSAIANVSSYAKDTLSSDLIVQDENGTYKINKIKFNATINSSDNDTEGLTAILTENTVSIGVEDGGYITPGTALVQIKGVVTGKNAYLIGDDNTATALPKKGNKYSGYYYGNGLQYVTVPTPTSDDDTLELTFELTKIIGVSIQTVEDYTISATYKAIGMMGAEVEANATTATTLDKYTPLYFSIAKTNDGDNPDGYVITATNATYYADKGYWLADGEDDVVVTATQEIGVAVDESYAGEAINFGKANSEDGPFSSITAGVDNVKVGDVLKIEIPTQTGKRLKSLYVGTKEVNVSEDDIVAVALSASGNYTVTYTVAADDAENGVLTVKPTFVETETVTLEQDDLVADENLTINGIEFAEGAETATVDKDTKATITLAAKTGYRGVITVTTGGTPKETAGTASNTAVSTEEIEITADTTISVKYVEVVGVSIEQPETGTISVTAGEPAAAVNNGDEVDKGTELTVTYDGSGDYTLKNNGVAIENGTVTADAAVAITAVQNTYSIENAVVANVDNVSIVPATNAQTAVVNGESVTITVTPASGYKATKVTINGNDNDLVDNAYTYTVDKADASGGVITVTPVVEEDKEEEFAVTFGDHITSVTYGEGTEVTSGETVPANTEITIVVENGYTLDNATTLGATETTTTGTYTLTVTKAVELTAKATAESGETVTAVTLTINGDSSAITIKNTTTDKDVTTGSDLNVGDKFTITVTDTDKYAIDSVDGASKEGNVYTVTGDEVTIEVKEITAKKTTTVGTIPTEVTIKNSDGKTLAAGDPVTEGDILTITAEGSEIAKVNGATAGDKDNEYVVTGNVPVEVLVNALSGGNDGEDDNTGDDNTGDDNTGDDNTGDDNTGDDNTGDDKTDDTNKGDDKTDDTNKGDDSSETPTVTAVAIDFDSEKVKVTDASGNATTSANIGDVLTITAVNVPSNKTATITVNGTTVASGKTYTVKEADKDGIKVEVTYKTKSTSGTGSSGGSSGRTSSGSSSTTSTTTTSTTTPSSAISAAATNGNVSVDLGTNTTVAAADLQSAAAKKLKLTLKVNDVFSWTLDASRLPANQTAIDFSVGSASVSAATVNSNVGGDIGDTVSFSLATASAAASPAVLHANVGKTNSGKFANLYKQNADGSLTFVGVTKVDANGSAVLDVKTSGTYVVVISKESKMLGDFDNSMGIDARDASALLKEIITALETGEYKGDFNGDGVVNARDASAILKAIVDGTL
jgi:hypothetical protein